MKTSTIQASCAALITVFVLGCLGGNVRASNVPRTSACAGIDAEDKSDGYAALQSGRWVGPAHVAKQYGKVTFKRAVGVELYVAAKPGLTAPWLHRAAECRIEEEVQSGASSPFGVSNTRVEVRATTAGYLVRITGRDRAGIEQLLQRIGG
jgi:hypothetical protein